LTPPWETGSSLSPEAQAIIAALPPLPQPNIANATNITAASLVAGVTSDAAGDAVIHYGSNEMVLHAVPAAHVSADWFTIAH
jgi:hypothetical protein